MSHERRYEGPSNSVGHNKYINDSKRRVGTGLVREEWYTARLINPESTSIDHYAADILMQVVRVVKLKSGEIKVYAKPVSSDGSEAVDETDAVAMNRDGYFTEHGSERGYLLDAFGRQPRGLGALAAEAMVEV